MEEVNDVSDENLEAAATMYDELLAGTFYQKQLDSGFRVKFIGEGKLCGHTKKEGL